MSELLGVIRNISTARAMLDLHVFDDGIVVARGSLRSAVRKGAEAGVFRSGSAIVAAIAGPETGPDPALSDRDRLLAAHPSNAFIPFDTLTAVRLKKGWFGSGRLELVGTDGVVRRYEWKRIYNDFEPVEAMLRRALGPKLTRS
jgi:hypothetical protein